MNELPLVSVVVPVYNMESLLPETIRSILSSDYPRFEVILVDDGSSDGSWELAQRYAREDDRIRAFSQANAGPSAARNHAIREARGELILPIDADDLVSPDYIARAAEVLTQRPEVKVVSCRVEYFGDKTGPMRVGPFSLRRLARKNMIVASSMFRRSDWERAGGYYEGPICREDWDFWIALFKEGGEFYRLPFTGLYYRVYAASRRHISRHKDAKENLIRHLNQRHAEFFDRMLYGPLRHHRRLSRLLNLLDLLLRPRKIRLAKEYEAYRPFFRRLPEEFPKGKLLYQGRNELREFTVNGETWVIKRFGTPHLFNRFMYAVLRRTKARRSYEYAQRLISLGLGSPKPVGYYSRCTACLLSDAYYVCLKSSHEVLFKELEQEDAGFRQTALTRLANYTARLHRARIYHKDYSEGNLIFDRETADIDLIDLNRIRFQVIGLKKGCRQFERLPLSEDQFGFLAGKYARARGFNPETCRRWMLYYHAQYIAYRAKKNKKRSR